MRVQVKVDVQDAMGANTLNTAGEALRQTLERLTGGRTVMSILSNAATERRAGASFALPLNMLRAAGGSSLRPEETARRLVLACDIAHEDATRAVTHNKGIMNGITSLAWAARTGSYASLSRFWLEHERLQASLELPLRDPFSGASLLSMRGLAPRVRSSLETTGRISASWWSS